jgi:hypothetical protein
VLGANKLLAMVKDIGNLHPITIGKMFLWLISCSIVLFEGCFKSTYAPISLEYWPLEVWIHFFNIQALLNLHPN